MSRSYTASVSVAARRYPLVTLGVLAGSVVAILAAIVGLSMPTRIINGGIVLPQGCCQPDNLDAAQAGKK